MEKEGRVEVVKPEQDIPKIYKILLITIVISIVLLTINLFFIYKEILGKDNNSYTLTDIIASTKDNKDLCNNIADSFLKDFCIKSYIINKAKQEQNADMCNEIKDDAFVRSCKFNAIVPAVAKKYYQESQSQNNPAIAPSNINLCEQLDNQEDKELCKNPKLAIQQDYHLLE